MLNCPWDLQVGKTPLSGSLIYCFWAPTESERRREMGQERNQEWQHKVLEEKQSPQKMRRGHAFGASDCHITLNTQGEWCNCLFQLYYRECSLMVSLNQSGTPTYFSIYPYPFYSGWHCTTFLVNTTPKCQWFFLKIEKKSKRRPIGMATCTTDQVSNKNKAQLFLVLSALKSSLLSLVLHQLQTW